MGKSDLFKMNVRELEIKADLMHVKLYCRKRCEMMKQTCDVLVNIHIHKYQFLKDSTTVVIEDVKMLHKN